MADDEKDRQTPAERKRLMELHKDHDEKVYGVRPDIVLDTTEEDADWIRQQRKKPKGT
jgi:hypothetical protein